MEGYMQSPEEYWKVMSKSCVNHIFTDSSWVEAFLDTNIKEYWKVMSKSCVNHIFTDSSWVEAFLDTNIKENWKLDKNNTNLRELKSINISQKILGGDTLEFFKEKFPKCDINTVYFEKATGIISAAGGLDLETRKENSSYPLTPLSGFNPQIRLDNDTIANINEEGDFCWQKGTSPLANLNFYTIGNIVENAPNVCDDPEQIQDFLQEN